MKNIVLKICVLFCTITSSAQQFENLAIADLKKEQPQHLETIMLQRINSTNANQVVQIGDYNVVNVESQQIQVQQTGEHQLLYYTETSKLTPSNLNVNMEGVNNYIEVYGNNSIMENMTINHQGNDKSIIIRNY